MSYDDVWTISYDAVYELWWCVGYDTWCAPYIYILMNVVLDMFDALCGNMMSMMIAWRLP